MNNKVVLGSLAMDLKRVALGYHRHSWQMTKRFYEEALLRKDEVDVDTVKPYMRKILKQISLLEIKADERVAEDALMYSILVQNYSLHLPYEK